MMFIFKGRTKIQDESIKAQKSHASKISELLSNVKELIKQTNLVVVSFSGLIGVISTLLVQIGFEDIKIIGHNSCSNSALSIEHLLDRPEKEFVQPIQTEYGLVDVDIVVYKNGDILTIYGNKRKWLCFPEFNTASISNLLINFFTPQVLAQSRVSQEAIELRYIQEQAISPNNSNLLEETKIYSNGKVESTQIDLKRGIILNQQIYRIQITPELQEKLERGVMVEEKATIDIR